MADLRPPGAPGANWLLRWVRVCGPFVPYGPPLVSALPHKRSEWPLGIG